MSEIFKRCYIASDGYPKEDKYYITDQGEIMFFGGQYNIFVTREFDKVKWYLIPIIPEEAIVEMEREELRSRLDKRIELIKSTGGELIKEQNGYSLYGNKLKNEHAFVTLEKLAVLTNENFEDVLNNFFKMKQWNDAKV